jgi:hypothetical protein
MRTHITAVAALLVVGAYSGGGATIAQGGSAGAAKNVVLVHGAFADDSSWSKVTPLLKAKGFHVTVGDEMSARIRLLAVYVHDRSRLRLAHFQSASLPA